MSHRNIFPKDRLGAMCDGVAAITATLLVIDLKTPFDKAMLQEPDWSYLLAQADLLLAWAISFLMVGVLWYEQHRIFNHVARVDPVFMVLVMMHLGFLSLLPFASFLIGEHLDSLVASQIFAMIMALNGMTLALQAHVASRRAHLHAGPEARHLSHRAKLQVIAYASLAVFSVVVAALHVPLTGVVAWALSPLIIALFEWRTRRHGEQGGFHSPGQARG